MAAFSDSRNRFAALALHVGQLCVFFFVPGGAILLAAFLFIQSQLLLHWLPVISMVSPYVVLGAALFIGWRFNRTKLALAVLAIVFLDRLFFHFSPDGSVVSGDYKTVYNAICFLLPLNLIAFYFISEKGVFTPHVLLRLVFLFLQAPFIDFLCKTQQPFCTFLGYSFFSADCTQHTTMPQLGIIAFSCALVLFFIMYLKKQGNSEQGFIWAIIACYAALSAGRPGSATTIYFATAGLILVISLLEDAYCMAFQDELTGIPARRALNEALVQLPAKFAVAMLDIDFFKKFNDKHGHDVGDQVLCMVAAKLQQVGGGGRIFRYGGEEFTVLFPGKTSGEILPVVERLRKSIENARFYVRHPERPRKKPKIEQNTSSGTGSKISVTISIGVAEPKGSSKTPHAVIKAADKALYRAKKKGRNQVCT